MNIYLDNVNLGSTSGPNSFANKLIKYGGLNGCLFDFSQKPDAYLSFIETHRTSFDAPMYQRLDGIYFNTHSNGYSYTDYKLQNSNIKRTYEIADGVIFQSEFNKRLTTKYFGEHPNSKVIHNGADINLINDIKHLNHPVLDSFEDIWMCASHWRPHKRLGDNIRYFLEHSGGKDCLVVAGQKDDYERHWFEEYFNHDKIFLIGNIPLKALTALYKRSKYFLHLAWLDHCPNVVVDARASGCTIVCSSTGGTKEIAGPDAIVIEEEEWNMEPVDLYNPPEMNFSKKIDNNWDIDYNMNTIVLEYMDFMGYEK
jgi:glycosyltransferase involved in cell wall biosynthesis